MAVLAVSVMLFTLKANAQAPTQEYLKEIRTEMKKNWPANRTINLVFHGHSVPAGYFRTPEVRTLEAYPQQVLQALKATYPSAVINVIVTAIGGENSEQGAKRFTREVLVHRPDVLFIDYALNDRRIGLEKARNFTTKMIRKALKKNIKVILLTPSPDLAIDIRDDGNVLAMFAAQIRQLARDHQIGLADSYKSFKGAALKGDPITDYMSQSNHPNRAGHSLIGREVMAYFVD
ncbi:MAG: SGNH/GDSL hydrolase family protein [Chryseosolibacter sp.]